MIRKRPTPPPLVVAGDDDIVHIILEEVGVGSSILPRGIMKDFQPWFEDIEVYFFKHGQKPKLLTKDAAMV